MLILSVESSCDETAVALVEDGRKVLADEIFSQVALHSLYGGVVPEIAARSHLEVVTLLADRALETAGRTRADIDAVACTYAPGLIGAVLVGVNFAKSAALALGVPLIPVHHIRGHIAANYLAYPALEPPFLCLAISGGNTMLVDVRGYTDMSVLGRTRDDAAGECFDKSARIMGAEFGQAHRPAVHGDNPYDMSFSGLKTAVVNIVHHAEQTGQAPDRPGLAASLCRAVSETLVGRTMDAAAALGYENIAVAGGVAANSRIRADFEAACRREGRTLFVPPLRLCGDNAAMIGAQGYYEYLAGHTAGSDLNAYATMAL